MTRETGDARDPEPGIRIVVVRPDGTTRRFACEGVVVVGRDDGADVVVADPAVSRRHLTIDATGPELVVTDLGSANGTSRDGRRVEGAVDVAPGDELLVGDTILRIERSERVPSPSPMPAVAATSDASASPGAPRRAAPSSSHHAEVVASRAGISVRAERSSPGARVVDSYLSAAVRARGDLGGIGSEGAGAEVTVHLVDPFADPEDGDRLVTSGAVVDGEAGAAWVVVTTEAPPEDPHRVLALLFGATLPSAAQLEPLLEGYGLHLAGVDDTNPQLVGVALPNLDAATGDLRGAMAVSFVRYLLARDGDQVFRQVLAAPAGGLGDTVREVYGAPLPKLEEGWRQHVAGGESSARAGEFLRLSLRYLRPYRARQVEIFALMLLSLAFTMAFPFVTRGLFDTAIPSGEFSEVLTLLGVLAVAFTISLVAGVRQAYQSAWVSGAVSRDIRQAMFDRLQALPASWYQRYPQGDVLSRLFNDVGMVQSGLSDAIGQGIFQVISLVVSAAIMLTLNLVLGIVVIIGAPLVAIVYRVMAGGAQRRSIVVQEDSSSLLGIAAESYRASSVVRLFGLAGRERRRFALQADRLFRARRRLTLFGGIFGLSVNMIVTLLRLGILGFGAWLILEGHFTIGGLVAFLSIMGEVLSPVTVLTTLGQDIQASMGALVRINEVLDAEVEGEASELPELLPFARELHLEGVSFSYGPDRRALDAIDVTIPAGSRVAFVGPSGSGKSTVLRLLMRMYDPDDGRYLLDGRDVREHSLESLRDQMGVVFQDPFLFDTTLRENIALGKGGASEDEVLAAASAAEIDSFVESLPQGYDTIVGDAGANLSGGQRQRVSIARALIRDPRLLLLDEATSALDPGTERQIIETLARVGVDRTTIAITHRLTAVVDYDQIFVIVAGAVVESGTHPELLAARGEYARLWAEQTGDELSDEPPFDVVGALGGVSLFRGLDTEALARVAERLRPFSLDVGDTMADGGGLVLVERGRGEVLTPAPSGDPVPVAELGTGDAFGLTAILGGPANASLCAATPLRLLFLDDAQLRSVAAEHGSVADALRGRSTVSAPTRGGTRVTRLSVGPRLSVGADAPVAPSAVGADAVDVRRASGAYPKVTA